jgi:hypothetical protein
VSTAPRQSLFRLDASLTESVLGMKKENYVSWQEILLELFPAMMDWEKEHSQSL